MTHTLCRDPLGTHKMTQRYVTIARISEKNPAVPVFDPFLPLLFQSEGDGSAPHFNGNL